MSRKTIIIIVAIVVIVIIIFFATRKGRLITELMTITGDQNNKEARKRIEDGNPSITDLQVAIIAAKKLIANGTFSGKGTQNVF